MQVRNFVPLKTGKDTLNIPFYRPSQTTNMTNGPGFSHQPHNAYPQIPVESNVNSTQMFPTLGNSTVPISSSIHSNGDYHPHNPHNIPPTSEIPWSNPNLPPRPVGNMPDSTGVPPQMFSNGESYMQSTFNSLQPNTFMPLDLKSTFSYGSQFPVNSNPVCKEFDTSCNVLANLRQKSREHTAALGLF
ncbi:uncharacterized protein TNIN_63031 [Trichonephila inaurata madagascariensis]|uniref:Uncharacterized protein n=1 Tax=Trichonephila inaurata madagascariensis TaxID=2747483 RepID=A0A8X6YEP7_9ARAC|nr:uncharacterized protein TNIN_63031 [Trichonephila inaurata madagascariensis]